MEKATLAACFGIIAVATLVGNILLVVVFLKKREWLDKVHTCLLLALAIQDISTAICLLVLPHFVLPSDVYKFPSHPTHRRLYCSIIWSQYIPFALSIVSIYTCLMLAIDRWLAVLRPMSYRRYCSSKKIIATMLILPWIAGFGFEIGTALNVEDLQLRNGSYGCVSSEYHSSPKNTVTVLFLVSGKGLLPAILMVIAYAQMLIKLMKTSLRVSREAALSGIPNSIFSSSRQNERHCSLKRITKMVCAASAIVMICWLPDQLYFGICELGLTKRDLSFENQLHVLAFLNTCLNPFVYGFSNGQYQGEFKKILCCFLKQQARPQVHSTNDLEERDRQV